MNRNELTRNQQELLEIIESLALSYSANAQPIPEKAFERWFEAAKGANIKELRVIADNWSKTSTRMMLPADLFKAVQQLNSIKREKAIVKEQELDKKPIPEEVRKELESAMAKAYKRNPQPTDWARRMRIKEAYGFALTKFQQDSWRRALGLPEDYSFDEYGEVFPIDNMPDQRRSYYHDCQSLFIAEYVSAHGLELVYDKELATKKYPTQPFAYDGAGEPVYAKEAA